MKVFVVFKKSIAVNPDANFTVNRSGPNTIGHSRILKELGMHCRKQENTPYIYKKLFHQVEIRSGKVSINFYPFKYTWIKTCDL
jgi:hypothetical protein